MFYIILAKNAKPSKDACAYWSYFGFECISASDCFDGYFNSKTGQEVLGIRSSEKLEEEKHKTLVTRFLLSIQAC